MTDREAAIFFGIRPYRVQPKVYRVACRLCGVTGREVIPKLAPNLGAREIRRAVREHARNHVLQAMGEHRVRLLGGDA